MYQNLPNGWRWGNGKLIPRKEGDYRHHVNLANTKGLVVGIEQDHHLNALPIGAFVEVDFSWLYHCCITWPLCYASLEMFEVDGFVSLIFEYLKNLLILEIHFHHCFNSFNEDMPQNQHRVQCQKLEFTASFVFRMKTTHISPYHERCSPVLIVINGWQFMK